MLININQFLYINIWFETLYFVEEGNTLLRLSEKMIFFHIFFWLNITYNSSIRWQIVWKATAGTGIRTGLFFTNAESDFVHLIQISFFWQLPEPNLLEKKLQRYQGRHKPKNLPRGTQPMHLSKGKYCFKPFKTFFLIPSKFLLALTIINLDESRHLYKCLLWTILLKTVDIL